jgi:ATP-dependent exoDNAse (exonuclease V) beta subunit
MNSEPHDQPARERFTKEWDINFAVVANAGSGKTTAISERLAAMALSERGSDLLRHTAVVTYTKKAAAQIERRARSVLLQRMASDGRTDVEALARLERIFFGTIHSFCLLLARRHGSTLGIHLNPTLVDDDDDAHWQEFLEQDKMGFSSMAPAQVAGFLRHESLDAIFELAKDLDLATAGRLLATIPPERVSPPSPTALALIRDAAPKRKGPPSAALGRNQAAAEDWMRRFTVEESRLPIAKPEGEASGIKDLYRQFFAPLKGWLAQAGGVLAAELSLRYRSWRLDRGIQTYADQLETALAVLGDKAMLEAVRAEGWRVILDEAQDTDPSQFAVLVEITRPSGASFRGWPAAGGAAPRAGHFCMVGDPQQGIYSKRADIRNFQEHVGAFRSGDGGQLLTFDVTFRTPRRLVELLNATLPPAFGGTREHNLSLPPEDGSPPALIQVPYGPLVPGPANIEGAAWRLPIEGIKVEGGKHVGDRQLAQEARQIARFLASGGPSAVGAFAWGDICVLAPRNSWLQVVRDEFEAAGLKTALQVRRNRNGDNPVYAWLAGLLAVVCDPDNTFEWVGVLREIFAVGDSAIADAIRAGGGRLRWDEPESHDEPISAAFRVLLPLIDRSDLEGETLDRFASDLVSACGLAGKARILDPEGGLGDELARLLARAAELGLDGGGPRAWLRDLVGSVGDFRAAGRPASDSINLLTSHSAKGLEWPVVIPVGLWRWIGDREPHGLRLVSTGEGGPSVVLDNEGIAPDTRLSIERARLRENVRLLYVTLTRAKTALVIPWVGYAAETESFAWLWDVDPLSMEPMPQVMPATGDDLPIVPAAGGSEEGEDADGTGLSPAPPLPKRILPHQLAGAPDLARAARHESALEVPAPAKDASDPLEYGVWWHETLEFMPWSGGADAVQAHGVTSLQKAQELGFDARGREEWDRLLVSEPCRLIRDPRWSRLAEVGVFAPMPPDGWIDGVIDLVLHDAAAREIWIVDWKTNRRAPGESDAALLARLAADYDRQLTAYGTSASGSFPGCTARFWVYSTVAGLWTGVGPALPV